ncbi:MAG: hypothetical protein ACI9XR_000217 [Flavobacterium sp.]|jgi:hypothetical protein
MKKMILILVSIFILGCNSDDDETVAIFEPIEITPSLIGKRNLSIPTNYPQQQNTVISDEVAWTNLKNQIDAYYQQFGINYTQQYFTENNIDFNSFVVIAIFDKIYTNGGHSIDITNITEFETNIIVTIENLQTGNQFSAASQPYHIVKIPKVNKPIVFNKI